MLTSSSALPVSWKLESGKSQPHKQGWIEQYRGELTTANPGDSTDSKNKHNTTGPQEQIPQHLEIF